MPHQSTIQSVISFGEVKFDKIVDDELELFSNIGRDFWGIQIDNILYDDKDMSTDKGPRVAILDSISSSI